MHRPDVFLEEISKFSDGAKKKKEEATLFLKPFSDSLSDYFKTALGLTKIQREVVGSDSCTLGNKFLTLDDFLKELVLT